jgi:hypothetical protein
VSVRVAPGPHLIKSTKSRIHFLPPPGVRSPPLGAILALLVGAGVSWVIMVRDSVGGAVVAFVSGNTPFFLILGLIGIWFGHI